MYGHDAVRPRPSLKYHISCFVIGSSSEESRSHSSDGTSSKVVSDTHTIFINGFLTIRCVILQKAKHFSFITKKLGLLLTLVCLCVYMFSVRAMWCVFESDVMVGLVRRGSVTPEERVNVCVVMRQSLQKRVSVCVE